jgi:hypothetical protein
MSSTQSWVFPLWGKYFSWLLPPPPPPTPHFYKLEFFIPCFMTIRVVGAGSGLEPQDAEYLMQPALQKQIVNSF